PDALYEAWTTDELLAAYPSLGLRISEAATEETASLGAAADLAFFDQTRAWLKRKWDHWRGTSQVFVHWPRVHEGDWERISLRLGPKDELLQIAYYQHHDYEL